MILTTPSQYRVDLCNHIANWDKNYDRCLHYTEDVYQELVNWYQVETKWFSSLCVNID